MQIDYCGIRLRDELAQDVEDQIRWSTVQTAWANWDAPWETLEELRHFSAEEFRKKELARLQKSLPSPRTSLEIEVQGIHIGSVSRYFIDQNYDYINCCDIREGQSAYCTLGIEINDDAFWGHGIGRKAYAAWILYLREQGIHKFFTQTWSGNERMIRMAKTVGFEECHRAIDKRLIHGIRYDALTFQLNDARFCAFCARLSEDQS